MIIDLLRTFWPLITAVTTVAVSLTASVHAILYKRDSRAAVAWVGLIWLVPFLGTILYVLLGINRIRRRVAGLRGHESAHVGPADAFSCSLDELELLLPDECRHLVEMARLSERLARLKLLKRNRITPLFDGDEVYPAMIEAIDRAERTISMTTYIFDNDVAGKRFVEAFARAVTRGVEVCVLVDAVGARYSMPPITGRLHQVGVKAHQFMSGLLPWKTPYINLRNHRKILVLDGTVGFTGGINIRAGHVLGDNPPHPAKDTHFEVDGPVVQQLQAAFVEDWQFTTRELLGGERWFPEVRDGGGNVLARVVPDGPDQDLNRMGMGFQGALAVARSRVLIMTPYFLPDRALISALNICALRGVRVDIVLPQQNNLKMVAWASMAQMWQVLEWGCNVWMSPSPFDHSKIMVVDGMLSLIGSSNWDPRSLRLNFELGLECYDAELAGRLEKKIAERMDGAHQLSLREVDSRPFPIKLRDGVFRLAAPYL